MKQFLILWSSITTLTISSTTFVNLNQNTTFTNNLQTNNNNDSQNSLFNNHYGYLNNNDWITNQSITDHKFYSYDTLSLAKYTFPKARNTFLVDNYGNLVYNPNINIPDKDKVNIENTKKEMIDHKKVTAIKNDYNPYSKSEYYNSYFSGDNTNWQYIQFGGVGKNIDISQQKGADKVEHSNGLSEALGLYYIAKAAISNKISEAIAQKLTSYFFSQSSLKEQIHNELETKIIDLIIDNNDIYNFIYKAPFYVNDKNYSLNYIFDKYNNLVNIYYKKWSKENIKYNINYNFDDNYNGTNSRTDEWIGPISIIKWKKYVRNYEDFLIKYPKITFSRSNEIYVSSQYGTDKKSGSALDFNTNNINNLNPDAVHPTIQVVNFHDGGIFGAYVKMVLQLAFWHDNNDIWLSIRLYQKSVDARLGSNIKILLNDIDFCNIMN